jgi:hypothetical protein
MSWCVVDYGGLEHRMGAQRKMVPTTETRRRRVLVGEGGSEGVVRKRTRRVGGSLRLGIACERGGCKGFGRAPE